VSAGRNHAGARQCAAGNSAMTNQRSRFRSVVYLTLAGLLSSLLTVGSPHFFLAIFGMFSVGMIFGSVLASCFCLCFGVRSPWKLGGFVITSIVAYLLALFSIGPSPFGFLAFPFTYPAVFIAKALGFGHAPRGEVAPVLLFGPGALGAFLVLTAGLFAISSQKRGRWSLLLKALIGSLVGGLLGAIGYALGPSLGFVLWEFLHAWGGPISSAHYQQVIAGGEANFDSVFLLWQTGVALLLGLLWWHGEARVEVSGAGESTEGASVSEVSERIPLAAKLFFIGGAVLLLFFVGRSIWFSYARAHTQRAIAQSIAEAPSTQNLRPLQPMPLGQALILDRVGDFVALNTYDSSAAVGGPRLITVAGVPRVYYSADYVKAEKGVTIAGPTDVSVSLTEYPNSAWASYELRNTPTPNAAYMYAKYRKNVMKFGNWVLQNSGQFYWPSGNNLLTVYFHNGERDEFLKAYLEKYPSDLRP
jgi:hypothetical protein